MLGGTVVKHKTFFIVTTQVQRSQSSSSRSAQTLESEECAQCAQQNYPTSLGSGFLRDYRLANILPGGTAAVAQDIFGIGPVGRETPATANIRCSMPMFTEGRFKSSLFRNGLQFSVRGDQYFDNAKDRICGQFQMPTAELRLSRHAVADFTGSHSRQEFSRGLFTATDFPLPAPGTSGSFPHNIYRGPGAINVHQSLLKNNQVGFLGERGNLQIRFDFYNILNRVNLRGVDNNMASGTFGRSVSTLDPRIVVLGARIVF